MEGAAQWTAYAWLAHTRAAAWIPTPPSGLLGQRRWWSQDEGLAVFRVMERLESCQRTQRGQRSIRGRRFEIDR